MSFILNALYTASLLMLLPWLLFRAATTGRYRKGLHDKLLGSAPLLASGKPVAWFHGVSLGEINLLTTLVAAFQRSHPGWQCLVSATTDAGLAEARKRFTGLPVVIWPFDFTWAVKRTLRAVNPKLIVLAESELWPNFLRIAAGRRIPIVLINGRISPRSFQRYAKVAWLARNLLFRHLRQFGMQSIAYAESLRQLGVDSERIGVTGSIKYDGACGDRANQRSLQLRTRFGLEQQELVWVAGSTHAPEETIVLDVFRRLRVHYPQLRLILAPRSPDRFEEVAQLVDRQAFSYVRVSGIGDKLEGKPAVLVLDTLGDLGACWGLADVGFTGGSMDGRRGGQSMIEPAAYGVPVVFGPHIWNFRDVAARLLEAGAAAQVSTPKALEHELTLLLENEPLRRERGEAARRLVLAQQGATHKTLALLDTVLGISPQQPGLLRAG